VQAAIYGHANIVTYLLIDKRVNPYDQSNRIMMELVTKGKYANSPYGQSIADQILYNINNRQRLIEGKERRQLKNKKPKVTQRRKAKK